jgi:dolichol-phosphate mannosyltransferase
VYIEKNSIKISAAERVFSLTFAALMRKFAVPNYGSGGTASSMCTAKVRDYLNQNIEMNSSLILQMLNAGFKSVSISMDYKMRIAGSSKWTLSSKIKLFIDSFVAFSFMPIRAISILGIILSLIGFLYAIVIVVSKIIQPETSTSGFPTLISVMLLGFGVTNISLGVIAEYLWRTYDAARGRPLFLIDKVRNVKGER